MTSLEDDFTPEQIERSRARRRDVLPLRLTSTVLNLAAPCVLGFTPLGAGIVRASGRLGGGGWIAEAGFGAVGVFLVLFLAGLPLSARGEVVNRRWGLSTRSWGLFAADAAKGFVIGALLFAGGAIGFYALLRAAPSTWWIWTALLAAGLVFVLSFLVPVLVEPVFNKFASMGAGPLRDRLLALVELSGLAVRDILVSDGSRRTTAANAYVSGLGRTRRVVVWDTTVEQFEDEAVTAIAAHELGHAARRDVLVFTAVGSLGAAATVLVLAAALRWKGLLTAAGVVSEADPRTLALILALVTVISFVTRPLGLAVSRRVEARADQYALDLLRDPAAIAAMEQRLAVVNIAELEARRWSVLLFASHPPIRDRIAHARSWAAAHDLPQPGPLRAD